MRLGNGTELARRLKFAGAQKRRTDEISQKVDRYCFSSSVVTTVRAANFSVL